MKSFGGIWKRIVACENLHESMRRAAKGKRERGPVREFMADAEVNLGMLQKELVQDAYSPRAYIQFRINDPKPRTISCAAFRDRIVHHALCDVCAPFIERRFISDSFACREGKGSHRAVLRAREFCRRYRYFLQLDIRHFFDSVDHDIAESLVHRLFRERDAKRLWSVILRHPLPGQESGKGLPIGNLTSQWLANFYLDGLDHLVKEEWRLPGYIRYMDDMVMFSDSKACLWNGLECVQDYLANERGLDCKGLPRPIPCAEGLPFLGFRIYPNILRLQRRKLNRYRRLVRRREQEFITGAISLEDLVASTRSATGILGFFGFPGLVSAGFEV